MKEILLKRDGAFSVTGGVLVSGDNSCYNITIDMGEPTDNLTAMAICQENGQYSADYSRSGNKISVRLINSMYADEGFITVRLAVSDGDSVLTAKEVVFSVLAPNNESTLATAEASNIDSLLATGAKLDALYEKLKDAYTKPEVDNLIVSTLNTGV